jgi:hypothetical protein
MVISHVYTTARAYNCSTSSIILEKKKRFLGKHPLLLLLHLSTALSWAEDGEDGGQEDGGQTGRFLGFRLP